MNPTTQGGGPLPPWMKIDDWLNATLDMTPFGVGPVRLRDAKMTDADDYDRCYAASNGNLFLKPQAALLRAYVRDGSSIGAPPAGSSIDAWELWIKKQHVKLVARLVVGILRFRAHQVEMDKDAAATPEVGAEPGADPPRDDDGAPANPTA